MLEKTTLSSGIRTDIQGLRALAVALVVIFHIWPEFLTGGFVGVDAFFVISGYLITKHLISEIDSTGTIRLAQFWAKRIRRLLPASLCVLLVSTLATYTLLPTYQWDQTLREIAASTIYIQNWMLINNSVNYLAIENEPTLVQHFWSLSLEEQFYIAWPIAMVSALQLSSFFQSSVASTKNRPLSKLKVIRNGMIAVFFASLAYSIYVIYEDAGLAYFSTATRAWEFAVGGLLVFGLEESFNEKTSSWFKALFSWCGFALIVSSAYLFSADTLFPGYIALLPVVGTAMVIIAKTDNTPLSFGYLSRFYPVQFLGGLSYSAYLWHWPLIILIPIFFGNSVTPWVNNIIIVVATVSCSWLSKKFVEDPFLQARAMLKIPRQAFGAALSGMASVLLACFIIYGLIPTHNTTREASTLQFSSTQDIQAALYETLSLSEWPEINQQPGRHAQVSEWIIDRCNNISVLDQSTLDRCLYGNKESDKLLVVIGDSWATHLLPAIKQVFSSQWRIQVLTLSQCPIADIAVHRWGKTREYKECAEHRQNVIKWLNKNQPDLVIASDSPISTISRLMDKQLYPKATIIKGLEKTYLQIKALKLKVVHIESPPRVNCYFEKTDNPQQCKTPNSAPMERQLSEAKIAVARSMNFNVIDLTYWVCTDKLICPNQIGNQLIKADGGHFSNLFSRNLGALLGVEAALLGVSI